jgi:hypothetical protein
MATRPCKPDADMKGLWRLLLPDTPFPACAPSEDTAAPTNESVQQANEADAPRRDDPRTRRD